MRSLHFICLEIENLSGSFIEHTKIKAGLEMMDTKDIRLYSTSSSLALLYDMHAG